MAQSLTQIYIHAVFGTKRRQNFIHKSIEDEYHKYMTGIFKGLNCPLLRINSMPDHTHIIFRMSKQITISKVMEVAKKESSKWFKTKNIPSFQWQAGYGAFSISKSRLDLAINYVKRQKQHHQKVSQKEEIDKLMKLKQVTECIEKYY
ncbi:MAG: IS200/IS605 family transposase [Bacteroidota bacterium]